MLLSAKRVSGIELLTTTQEATVIFINNYAFQSDLETRILRELLVELKHGTKIISTKPYVPVKGKLRFINMVAKVTKSCLQAP